jgi:hypothetical protein
MHHNVGSKVQRVLQRGRSKGRIYGQVGLLFTGFGTVVSEIARLTGRVEWRFNVDDISRAGLVDLRQIHFLDAGQSVDNVHNTMASMVSVSDEDSFGVKKYKHRVKGRESSRVRDYFTAHEAAQ